MKNNPENQNGNEKMKFAHNCKHVILLLRWSYTVPLLCYFIFFLTIWMLSVPLKPIKIVKEIRIHKPEDTFEIRMKNSNFNSDRKDGENNLLNDKNEYLVNVNTNENANKDQTEILQEVFQRADKDKNDKLDSKELAEWIRKKIVEHISSAVSNNYALFTLIDVSPRNGVITWKEYHTYFLKKRGFSKRYVENHDEKRHKGLQRSIKDLLTTDILEIGWSDEDEDIVEFVNYERRPYTVSDQRPDRLEKCNDTDFVVRFRLTKNTVLSILELKIDWKPQQIEQIMRDKASWMEAARSNPDTLTVDEFLAFTHPESSAANQLALVDELYDKFDRDGDELLTEDEFAILQTEGNNDETVVVRQDENERRAEFRKSVDLNGDGRADRRELLHYVAPQSPRHSEHEAEALLALADGDHDNMLSLDEILAHPDLFLKSKMVDTGRSFHDEF